MIWCFSLFFILNVLVFKMWISESRLTENRKSSFWELVMTILNYILTMKILIENILKITTTCRIHRKKQFEIWNNEINLWSNVLNRWMNYGVREIISTLQKGCQMVLKALVSLSFHYCINSLCAARMNSFLLSYVMTKKLRLQHLQTK